MSTLILTPILATTLFFFAQINTQKLHSLPQISLQQEEIKTEHTHDSIASEWFKVLGLTSLVSLMWLAVVNCNRPKNLNPDNHSNLEEENYFG